MLHFCFLTSKIHILARNRVVWRILRENSSRAWAVGRWKNPEKRSRVNIFDAQISRIRWKEPPWGIVTKFCTLVDIYDIITCVTFNDDRLRGLGVAMGLTSGFSVDCVVNRTLSPKPCECVVATAGVSQLLMLTICVLQVFQLCTFTR